MGETRIDSIRVEGRHRTHYGDIDALAASMADVGLIQPVVIQPDLRLVAGERRIRAAISLGWETVPTRIISHLTEARDLLRAERDENTCREEMTVSEKVSLARAIEELERPAAAERKAEGRAKGGEVFAGREASGSREPEASKEIRSADIAGDAVGLSRVTYQRAKYVIDTATDETEPDDVRIAAQEAMKKMDAGEIGVVTAQKLVNAAAGRPQRAIDRTASRPMPKGRTVERPAASPKYGGNRRKHAQQVEALVVAISGGIAAFVDVQECAQFDLSITSGEAARLADDLTEQIRSLNRIRNLLKECSK